MSPMRDGNATSLCRQIAAIVENFSIVPWSLPLDTSSMFFVYQSAILDSRTRFQRVRPIDTGDRLAIVSMMRCHLAR